MSGETGESGRGRRLLLLVNWGIGLETLRTVESLPGYVVAQVVTRAVGRPGDPWRTCVHRHARERGLPLAAQERTGHGDLRRLLLDRRVDLMIVHAYPRVLPESVFAAPPRGSVNVHASLLPRHRGPAPAHGVLRDRDPVSGITSHCIDAGVDTGPIVAQESFAVGPDDTVETLVEKAKGRVPPLVRATLARVFDPGFRPAPQDERLASWSPRP